MIGIYNLTNCSAVIIEDIIYDTDDYVLVRFTVSDEEHKRGKLKYKIYYDNGRAYFQFASTKIYLDEVMKEGEKDVI